MEALSDPSRAKNFAGRIRKLISDAKGNERVREQTRRAVVNVATTSRCAPCFYWFVK